MVFLSIYLSMILLLQSLQQVASASNNTVIPFDYPLFKQCDDRWTDDIMDTKTICQVGCLMSSTSMGLAGTGIPIKSILSIIDIHSTPKTLNIWLKNNDGYDGSNDLIESAVPNIDPERISWPDDAMHRTNDLPYETVKSYLDKGRIVIANVHNGGHFVLLTGYSLDDGDTFTVNDPGYDVTTYSYSKDVVGYRIFDMVRS
jgi:hypothetical protein